MRFGILAISTIVFLAFFGCGGGSSSSDQKAQVHEVKLTDDWIKDANVTDSNNMQARYVGKGVYVFDKKPSGEILLKGGIFENSNVRNKMDMRVGADSKLISPLSSFLFEYPKQKLKLFEIFGDDEDFIKEQNIALFKISKIIYILASNSLIEHFENSLKEVHNFQSVLMVARSVSSISPRSNIINAQLSAITLSFFDVEDMGVISKIVDTNSSLGSGSGSSDLKILNAYNEANESLTLGYGTLLSPFVDTEAIIRVIFSNSNMGEMDIEIHEDNDCKGYINVSDEACNGDSCSFKISYNRTMSLLFVGKICLFEVKEARNSDVSIELKDSEQKVFGFKTYK